jgi:ABC-type lipoprotein release transport system permease subunit
VASAQLSSGLFAVSLASLHISQNVLIALGIAVGLILILLLVGKVPLTYNLRNLSVRWLTTILTALAFTLVIGLLTVMMAFVNGMYQLTENSGHTDNLIILSQGTTDETFSNLGFVDVGDIENQPGVMRTDDNRPLCSRETYLVLNQLTNSTVPGRPRRRFTQLRGIEDPGISAAVHRVSLYEGGSWFSDAGVRQVESAEPGEDSLIEGVLGEGVAREFGKDRGLLTLKAGDQFELGGRKWIIAGVMQSAGTTFDSEVWAKRSLVAPMFGKQTYTSLVVRATDPETADTLQKYFSNDYKKAAVSAQIETAYFSSLSEINKQFLYSIIFVTIFIAIGGVFGVMNTMFAAISQRTKDIGVLRLIGFARGQILVSFLLESVVIALVGGLLGCACGSLCDGFTANSIVGSGAGGGKFVVLRLVVDANTIALGILLAVAMGFLGGFVPAVSAVRLKALDALR